MTFLNTKMFSFHVYQDFQQYHENFIENNFIFIIKLSDIWASKLCCTYGLEDYKI